MLHIIFTVCTDGKYGPECNSPCSDRHCKAKHSPCDRVNGSCDGSCDAGWQGDDCSKRKCHFS